MLRTLTESEIKMVSGGAPGDPYELDGQTYYVLSTTVDEIGTDSTGDSIYHNVDWGYAGYMVRSYWSYTNYSTGF